MKIVTNWVITLVLVLAVINSSAQTFKIAFGSCANQSSSLPVFDTVVAHNPNLFVFLGDNVYNDTDIYDSMVSTYNRMANKPSFKNLKAHVPLIATWDDHDYGRNDAGKYFSAKQQSKQAFLSFFDEPQNSERRNREGIYQSYYYPVNGKMVQVILLDVRWFRDNLLKYKGEKRFNPCYMYRKYYSAYKTADSTFLGDAQWQWLEQELRKPADVRIIGSGSQFGITWNGYESWANFPHERKRMLELIKTTQAKGVVFISGDVHYAEVSKINYQGLYPIYDVTASGLSSTWEFATPNKNRVAGPVMQNHFGLITINWADEKPYLLMEIWDKYNKKCVSIKELLFNLN
jgi:alkaline phosphatase D